jgi:tetratricopeptide (TPR) repeat protein
MKRAIVVLAGLLALLQPGAAQADSGTYLRWKRCADPALDADVRILACNQLIKDNVTGVGFAYIDLGDIYAERRDYAHAIEAFSAVVNIPQWPEPFIHRGEAYAASGDYEKALADANHLMAMPYDSAKALNTRCWVRAIANKELDLALADCDAALKDHPGDAAKLDSRGLVLFRLGRFADAVATYGAALKERPRQASSLYMRGLAERAGGDAAAGDADVKAALAVDPKIADFYDRLGVAKAAP